MKATVSEARRKCRVAIDAALLFIVILLITQMWLLTATLESYLSGHSEAVLPGMLISGILFCACAGMYRLVVRLDSSPEAEQEPHGLGPWEIR